MERVMTPQPSDIVLLVCMAVLAWQILQGLRRGRVSATRKTHFNRDEQPAKYWGMIIILLAIAAGLVWLASRSALPKRLTESGRIYAVTAVVREEMREGRSAAFRNVRADAESGFVCGEVTLEAGQRRFFGNVAAGSAQAVVEQQEQRNFDATFARLCGGKWVLPPAK
jgi:hypothetical protein